MGPQINEMARDEFRPKTGRNCNAMTKRTGCNEWFRKNLMLVVTLSGVVFGVVEGEFKCDRR